MATTIILEEQTAQALQSLQDQATARNMPLDRFLRALADHSEQILGPVHKSPHDLTQSEFEQWLKDVPAGLPTMQPLPTDFSRVDLYEDHD